jgi:hypothetical protein
MQTNRDTFFENTRSLFGGRYNQTQVNGLNAILDEWDRRLPNGDLRWLAYMLATAFHETARTMQPVREAYWLSENWRKTNLRYYPYYGRGYVQLTWKDNYRRASAYVGADLVANPDLAMRPDFAASIMFVGMTEGWFRGDTHGRNTLSRCFNGRVDDPVGAREIINGREWKLVGGRKVLLASILADYHSKFLTALSPARAPLFEFEREAEFTTRAPQSLRDAPPLAIDLPSAYAETYDTIQPDGETETFEALRLSPHVSPNSYIYAGDDADSASTAVQDASDLIQETIRFASAYVTNNKLDAGDVPEFIASVHMTLKRLHEMPAELAPPDETMDKSDGIEISKAGHEKSPISAAPHPLSAKDITLGRKHRGVRKKESRDHQ